MFLSLLERRNPALLEAAAKLHRSGVLPPNSDVLDLVEEPAVAYVSEVSHLVDGAAYVFGGGLYADPVIAREKTEALVGIRGVSSGSPQVAGVWAADGSAPLGLDSTGGAR